MTVSRTRIITECAIMIALATILSFFKVSELPFGGSVTMFSQVPIIIIGYRHGVRQGIFTGAVHGMLQLILQGLGNFAYVKGAASYLILIVFDYLVAFGVLGLGGAMFSKIIKNQSVAIALGSCAGSLLRLLCHFLTGVTIWGEYASGWKSVWIYSLAYNASYMVPELIVTVVGTAALAYILDLKSQSLIRKKGS